MTVEYEGVCGTELFINTKEDGKVAITLDVKKMIVGDVSRDEFAFMVAATMFRHVFADHLSPHDLQEADFHVIAEVPEAFLAEIWRDALADAPNGALPFKLMNDPVTNELSKFVPQIVVKEDDSETDNE